MKVDDTYLPLTLPTSGATIGSIASMYVIAVIASSRQQLHNSGDGTSFSTLVGQ